MFQYEDEATTQRCTRTLQQLSKWRSSLCKEIRQRKTEVRIQSKAAVGLASNPQAFLESPQVRLEVKKALEAAITSVCTPQQHRLLLSFMSASIVYPNAQRPGVIQYMTINEFHEREENEEGNFLINVLHHKTSSTTGAVDIIIDKELEEVIESYLENIRVHTSPQRKSIKERLFITHTGNEFFKISETIIQVANSYGYDIPTATINRKVTATAARETLTQQQALAIHSHMSHAPETSMRSYQFPTLEDSVDTHQPSNNYTAKILF